MYSELQEPLLFCVGTWLVSWLLCHLFDKLLTTCLPKKKETDDERSKIETFVYDCKRRGLHNAEERPWFKKSMETIDTAELDSRGDAWFVHSLSLCKSFAQHEDILEEEEIEVFVRRDELFESSTRALYIDLDYTDRETSIVHQFTRRSRSNQGNIKITSISNRYMAIGPNSSGFLQKYCFAMFVSDSFDLKAEQCFAIYYNKEWYLFDARCRRAVFTDYRRYLLDIGLEIEGDRLSKRMKSLVKTMTQRYNGCVAEINRARLLYLDDNNVESSSPAPIDAELNQKYRHLFPGLKAYHFFTKVSRHQDDKVKFDGHPLCLRIPWSCFPDAPPSEYYFFDRLCKMIEYILPGEPPETAAEDIICKCKMMIMDNSELSSFFVTLQAMEGKTLHWKISKHMTSFVYNY